MKTLLYKRNGSADAVLEFADKPVPEPRENEVLVKLATSGVNPSDVKSRAGRPLAFDFIVPHSDGAGVVDGVGSGVNKNRLGERVWIWNGQWQRQYGTAAEYISVPETQAVYLDDDVSFETAACFGIPGLTAAHAINLVEHLDAKTLLVTGAASSVGHLVTQMASGLGRKVYGTASSAKQDLVITAGAAACIDYRNEDVGGRLLELTDGEGVDAIVDMDFSSTLRLVSSAALKPKGTIISYGSNDMGGLEIPFRDLLFKSIQLQFFLVYELDHQERKKAIERLNAFVREGSAEFRVSHSLPFEDAVRAHELVENGKANGNVVLTI